MSQLIMQIFGFYGRSLLTKLALGLTLAYPPSHPNMATFGFRTEEVCPQ